MAYVLISYFFWKITTNMRNVVLGWVDLGGSRSTKRATPGFILTITVVFAVTWFVLRCRARTRNSLSPLPPGPRGLPFLGNLLSLDPEMHSYFDILARTYGPIFKFQFGGKLGVVISSPDIAREVLKDHDITFANRDCTVAGLAITYGGSDIASASYGPEWRMLRKVCVLKMLSNKTLDSVYELRRREVRQTVKYLYSRTGSTVNVGEQLFLTAMNVMTNTLWGATVEGEERESLAEEFRKAVYEMTNCVGKPNVSDFFPVLAPFDLQGIKKKASAVLLRFDSIFEKMIAQRLQMGTAADVWKERKDFLQFLLQLKEEGDGNTPLTMMHLKALLVNMVAGTDTSSNTSEFALAEMMNRPEVLRRVQHELESVVGKDNIVEESHTSKLTYLKAVMKETLRLHPTVPMAVPHCPSETRIIGGYNVPRGSFVFVNLWAIHRDPSNWENPLEFDPSRFLDSKWDYSGSDFRYIPFGSGRRMCPGSAMAERMVLFSVATLIHSFDWRLPEGEKLDLSEKFGLALRKRNPLVAIPTPRLSDPALYE